MGENRGDAYQLNGNFIREIQYNHLYFCKNEGNEVLFQVFL